MNIRSDIINVGTGAGLIHKQKTNQNTHELKSIKAGSNITVTNNTDDITIAAAAGITQMTWMDVIPGAAMGSDNAAMVKNFFGNIASCFNGIELEAENDNCGYMHTLHEGYASGQIQFRLIWAYRYDISSADANNCDVSMLFVQHDGNKDAAMGSTVNIAMTPTAGTHHIMVSDWTNITPGGTYNAASVLFIKVQREDSNSDRPVIGIVKLKYTINL